MSYIAKYCNFMLDFEPLWQFSRHNCVAICSFLVPANLTATIASILMVARNKSLARILWSKRIASVLAITLFIHVSTWFLIGVITPVTFILFGLGITCLVANSLGVAYRREIVQLLSTKTIPPLT